MSNKMVIRTAFLLDVPVTTILDYPLFDKWAGWKRARENSVPQIIENVTADTCADSIELSRRNRAFVSALPEHDRLIEIAGYRGWLTGTDIERAETIYGEPFFHFEDWGEDLSSDETSIADPENYNLTTAKERLERELDSIPGDWRDLDTLYADMASLFAQSSGTHERAEFAQQLETIRHVWRGRRAGKRFPRKIL